MSIDESKVKVRDPYEIYTKHVGSAAPGTVDVTPLVNHLMRIEEKIDRLLELLEGMTE